VLDVGCGVGRNLAHLGSRAVGVDHNAHSVEVARSRGCTAFTPEQLITSGNAEPGSYDSLLAAHLLEHLPEPEATELLGSYLPLVRRGGRVGVRTPSNLLFFLAALVLLGVCLHLSWEVSRLEDETRRLAEEHAVLRLQVERLSSVVEESRSIVDGGRPAP
jgi:2-polyprenyl-3-methyl-5-hydroxy-6-metoxy-1,4-benzoquinol methylase